MLLPPPSWTPEHGQEDFQALPNLKHLKMYGNASPLCRVLELMKQSPATLTRLDLTDCDLDYDLSQLRTLLETGQLSKLTILSLSRMSMNDDIVSRFAEECPLLEHVEFSRLRITGISLKALGTRTAIKTLKLIDCNDISADAIEWARGKSIIVNVRMWGHEAATGRRVRCD